MANLGTQTTKRVEITPRHMSFEFPDDMPKYYAGGDPFQTHLMNALSLVFPAGEQSFIDSVRHFRDQIDDPELSRQVRAFIAQEAFHSREHEALNDFLRRQGLPVDEVYAEVEKRIAETAKVTSPEARLAITCALEHFTAIMARGLLESPDLLAGAPENIRMLMTWHAIEEMEHKAVAFDVFQKVSGSYRLRVAMMVFASGAFLYNTALLQRNLMALDGQSYNIKSWVRGIARFWGPRGFYTRLIPAYLDYYRPGFHPWQSDDTALLTEFTAIVERYRIARTSARAQREKQAA